MAKTIVLAHGILGFDKIGFLGITIKNYFKGVEDSINKELFDVIAPEVSPAGSVNKRANELISKIPKDAKEIYIIAHSMGGLDARKALYQSQDLRQNIKALVTIGTPHDGSEVADKVTFDNDLVDLFQKAILPPDLQGIFDLRKRACKNRNDIIKEYKYKENIQFFTIAGVKGSDNLSLPFSLPFKASSFVGGFANIPNDGVVTRDSATRRQSPWKNLDDWPVDHPGLIGWFDATADKNQFQEHIERYIKLIALITGVDEQDVRKKAQ